MNKNLVCKKEYKSTIQYNKSIQDCLNLIVLQKNT